MISFPYRLAHLWSLLWGQLHQNAAGVAFAWFFIGGQSKACETRKADDADPEREHGFPSGCKRLSRSHVHLASKFCQVSMPGICFRRSWCQAASISQDSPQNFFLWKFPKLKTGCSGPWKTQMRFDTVGELSLSLHSCASSTLEASTALTC